MRTIYSGVYSTEGPQAPLVWACEVAHPTGFDPATSALTGRRANQAALRVQSGGRLPVVPPDGNDTRPALRAANALMPLV